MVGSQAFECGKIGAGEMGQLEEQFNGLFGVWDNMGIYTYLEVTVWISLELDMRGLVVLA